MGLEVEASPRHSLILKRDRRVRDEPSTGDARDMARRAAVLVALAAAPATALVAPVAPLSTSQRQRTRVQESLSLIHI